MSTVAAARSDLALSIDSTAQAFRDAIQTRGGTADGAEIVAELVRAGRDELVVRFCLWRAIAYGEIRLTADCDLEIRLSTRGRGTMATEEQG